MQKYYLAVALIILVAVGSYLAYYQVSKDGIADQTAMRDISQLQEKISSFVQRNKRLPRSLSELDLVGQKVSTRISNYEYTPQPINLGGKYSYQICADFKTTKTDDGYAYTSDSYFSSSAGHQKGTQCFKLQSTSY